MSKSGNPGESANPASSREAAIPAFYLPDFCATRSVFAVVLIAELVALVITLAREELRFGFWIDLGRTSLFLLWISLCSAAVLCASRSHLARIDTRPASAIALGLLVAVTLLISEATYWLGRIWFDEASVGNLFPTDHPGFLLRNLFIAFIVSALALRYFFVTYEWRRNVEMKAHSRLEALQARIRPHFLFNSMNTIAALTRTDPRAAEEAVENLADLFRANLKETRTRIPLKEELELARLYQRIEEQRLGTRLQVKWNLDSLPLDTLVPSLLVQPLLENAIYHGIESLPEGGTVEIGGHARNGLIEIEISNPLPLQNNTNQRQGNQIALDNIRERLQLAFPTRAQIEVKETDERYSVTLKFAPHENPHR